MAGTRNTGSKADLVIGSGPSGVAVATALLARGRRVIMLDEGKWLETGPEALRRELAQTGPDDFDAQTLRAFKTSQQQAAPDAIMRFGSQFAVEAAVSTFDDLPAWFGLRASRAKGGLSNVWGASVLPHRQADISDWPVSAEDMAPHYRAVTEFMPVSGLCDDLQELFPTFDLAGHSPLPQGPQADALLQRLTSKKAVLDKLGVSFGAARQAVGSGCRLCGLCLYGCPYHLIYSAADTVDRLKSNPNFSYTPGHTAIEVAEDGESVRVSCRLSGGADIKQISGRRVFVATGVLETARLMLNSFGEPGDELVLLDSHHALMPLLESRLFGPRSDPARLHTLTQAFLEISDPAISPHLVHTQLYTYNDFYAREMQANYGRRLPFAASLFAHLGRRLVVAQSFLHSAHSDRMGLSLMSGDVKKRLTVRQFENGDHKKIMPAAQRRLARALRLAGLVALKPAARPGKPGSSFHCGGTMPMRRAPKGWESDRLGRAAGLSRVHVVDASLLPSIPATTITFSVMANAYRIGLEVPE